MDRLSYHKRRYERDNLVAKVERAGFELIKTTSFVSILLPFMLLNRFGKREEEMRADLHGEFEVHPLLNAFLLFIMSIEVLLIRAGITFRFGDHGCWLPLGQNPNSIEKSADFFFSILTQEFSTKVRNHVHNTLQSPIDNWSRV